MTTEVPWVPEVPGMYWMQLQGILGHTSVDVFPWDGRGNITATPVRIFLENAVWNTTGNTLTKAGAFASYTFLTGDKIEITGGTGVTPGTYTVAAKNSDDQIEIASSIGTNTNDVSGFLGGVMPGPANYPGRRVFRVHGYSVVISPAVTTDLVLKQLDGTTVGTAVIAIASAAGDVGPFPRLLQNPTESILNTPAGAFEREVPGGVPVYDGFSASKDETAGAFNVLFSLEIQ